MSDDVARAILVRVQRCLPSQASLPLHEPTFSGKEQGYLAQCINSGWVSTAGHFIGEFEAGLCNFTGAQFAVAMVNGTAALQICLQLADVSYDDEVIVPALTFVATANAVKYCGATPHFADVSQDTLGLDPSKLADHLGRISHLKKNGCYNRETGKRIRAVVPMHTFGCPVDMDGVFDVCERFRLALIEDAAESLGSRYRDQHTGFRGQSGAISFNGNKILTTGGGGAILTNSPQLAAAARHLATTARISAGMEFVHDQVGYNYRMPNLNAALGLAQLEKINWLLDRKRTLAKRYAKEFDGFPDAHIFQPPAFASSNNWLNTLILHSGDLAARDLILQILNGAGIGARPAWRLMHRLPMFQNCPRMNLDTSEALERQIINLPSSAHYS